MQGNGGNWRPASSQYRALQDAACAHAIMTARLFFPFVTMSLARVAIAQLNCRVGDLAGNCVRILAAARAAHGLGADVLVTPELALTGYSPRDLLLRPVFLERAQAALDGLRADLAELSGLHVVVGHPLARAGRLYNAASVFKDGQTLATYCKRELPNYSVFNETRYFSAGREPCMFAVKGVRFALNICEDAWFDHTARAAAQAGAQVLLIANASPWRIDKHVKREQTIAQRVRESGCAVVYANLVGGQDELVFDGASFAMDKHGAVAARLPAFAENISVVEVSADGAVRSVSNNTDATASETEAQVWAALKLALSDYLDKNGFNSVILGLSGGIDSAVVLALAVDALGANRVRTVMMPSPYTADISLADAREMAARLGVRHEEIPISPLMAAFNDALAAPFAGLSADTTEENLQARIRGTLLMALSNKTGALVLTTGNKSELATGYCTLYGDMAGAFALIKDVPKTLVYRIARWRNEQSDTPVIPMRIITRPASAELAANQTDQDSLPPYEVLDAIVERAVERNQSAAEIIAAGLPADAVAQVLRLLRINEYKRQQAPIGPRVTTRAFGADWQTPMTNGFREPL